jgi:hypothetical protein
MELAFYASLSVLCDSWKGELNYDVYIFFARPVINVYMNVLFLRIILVK